MCATSPLLGKREKNAPTVCAIMLSVVASEQAAEYTSSNSVDAPELPPLLPLLLQAILLLEALLLLLLLLLLPLLFTHVEVVRSTCSTTTFST